MIFQAWHYRRYSTDDYTLAHQYIPTPFFSRSNIYERLRFE